LRRPGSAALDLCYVAAGWYDGFFEVGLSPWDIAAGSLMITEAGGLVGNFTGEPDYLYQREIVAGTPRVYGQLVQILAPFTRIIKDEDVAAADGEASDVSDDRDVAIKELKAAETRARRGKLGARSAAPAEPVDPMAPPVTEAPVPFVAPKPTRITSAQKAEEVASQPPEKPRAPRRDRDDSPF
jgi:myo-inositol-1(or 4)-monophosphatase